MTTKIILAVVAFVLALSGLVLAGGRASHPSDLSADGPWGCVGVEPVVGVCLHDPVGTLMDDLP